MYEYIKGIVTFVSPYYMVVETNQIGYQVAVANPFKYSAYLEKEVKVYLHQVIREDAHVLYGFSNLEEKQLFLKIISVSGIGPKSGMAIMALDDHAGLVTAIESEDAKYLTKFPGVGKKTAQQMILDLKGKLGELDISGTPKGTVAKQDDLFSTVDDSSLQEAIEALKALGYSEREIKRIKKELEVMTGKATDEILRHGLKLLMKK
ncbi:Holliday junction branch migration protein RuvA [Vagococcus fluvialis]|uniref:Holliday junction branch migration complex subunit RuvA n=2 Tax=Vagococcus fluvialis TaxID=2738 RepID=A0A369B4Y5_9ENTE|nr:Holliday junction branch migration protein RuvA [Vagococcus fluvialis]MDR2278081.1 Holliday junction branch migration protein RuvA [Vagococcus sp.]OTP33758.1 Holliday junction DNA helicase RuvA [Enterococcus sp. 6C8_DIV0013]MBO0421009.1 Holliday junction branch migration protein RuvA [Vagococcus fluvialis]MBO0429495.1 Holliday junction branch migration protein RuvA [Vagococcus fluvialis]MBO0443517.1 Holliday junction branch migration protein RuvA [Vagococcus fluvialis]